MPDHPGIFAWIAAYASEEASAEGKTRIAPYWRTLKSGGQLNEKYPGGIPQLRKSLEAEGHKISKKGKRWAIADFEKCLLRVST